MNEIVKLEIPSTLFERIKRHAIPFVDLTPVAVIERWADHFEGKKEDEAPPKMPAQLAPPAHKSVNPINPPSLLHTRCRGTFGNTEIRKWNDLLRVAHVQAFQAVKSFDVLRTITHAQIRKGNHEGDCGFHFIPQVGFSLQGVDANKAWEHALRLAQYLKVPIRIVVEWRNNEKAEFPGEIRTLEWQSE